MKDVALVDLAWERLYQNLLGRVRRALNLTLNHRAYCLGEGKSVCVITQLSPSSFYIWRKRAQLGWSWHRSLVYCSLSGTLHCIILPRWERVRKDKVLAIAVHGRQLSLKLYHCYFCIWEVGRHALMVVQEHWKEENEKAGSKIGWGFGNLSEVKWIICKYVHEIVPVSFFIMYYQKISRELNLHERSCMKLA